MRRLVASQRGMTVAEVLIASAIIGTGLVALSAAIPLASYGLQEGSQLSTASFLATQRIEQVRNARWEAGPPLTDDLGWLHDVALWVAVVFSVASAVDLVAAARRQEAHA